MYQQIINIVNIKLLPLWLIHAYMYGYIGTVVEYVCKQIDIQTDRHRQTGIQTNRYTEVHVDVHACLQVDK